MKRQWFKHFSDASQGASLRSLWDSGDLEGYGFFWRLLEMMCQFESKEKPGSMTIHWAVLRRELGWTIPKCRHVAERVCLNLGIELKTSSDNLATFNIPKWLELQSSWGGKRQPRFNQDPGRSRSRSRSRKREREREDESTLGHEKKIEPERKREPEQKVDLSELILEWQNTLDFYKIKIDAKQDDHTLSRLCGQHGFENLKLAIRGFRFEPTDTKYDPSKNCALYRLQDQKRFERLRNLGAQAKPQTKKVII